MVGVGVSRAGRDAPRLLSERSPLPERALPVGEPREVLLQRATTEADK